MKYLQVLFIFIILSCAPITTVDNQKLSMMVSRNIIINRSITYTSDLDLYGVIDHWATHEETSVSMMGDCDDYVIYKLKEFLDMGVPSNRLKMAYVYLGEGAHLVLEYYDDDTDDPLIFDNVTDLVLRRSQRNDLRYVYSIGEDYINFRNIVKAPTPVKYRKYFK